MGHCDDRQYRGETLDDAFRRVRDLDVSMHEQLRTLAETTRRERPEFAAAVDRLVERLRRYGAGESAPQIGEPMPPFVLPDHTSQLVSLEELLDRGPAAVTFHRGHWCPYCRININALAQAHKEVAADGGQIVAIMPDRQKFVTELKTQSNVPCMGAFGGKQRSIISTSFFLSSHPLYGAFGVKQRSIISTSFFLSNALSLAASFFNGWRSTPGTIPATSQLD
jgi:peroxiredoxin